MNTTQSLSVITAGCCGVQFAMPDFLWAKLCRTGATYWCPNGHRLSQSDTEEDRLRKRNARLTHQLDQTRARLESEKRSKAAIKGHLTRVQKRIANGVCPCCQRSFANVRRHMSSQHPEYVEDLRAKEAEVADG